MVVSLVLEHFSRWTFALEQIQTADSLEKRIANGRLGSSGPTAVKMDRCLVSAESLNCHQSLESRVLALYMKQHGVIANGLTATFLHGHNGTLVTRLVMVDKVIVTERCTVTLRAAALRVQTC